MRSQTGHSDAGVGGREAARRQSAAADAGTVAALLLVLLLASVTGCFGKDEAPSSQGDAATSGDVKATVGKTVKLGAVSVVVTSLAPTPQPALPDTVMSPGGRPLPAEGDVYYQARVRVANAGKKTVRVDPWDFVLVAGDVSRSLDPAASGPPARTLLPGTSLSLILTYRVAAGKTPDLVYEPEWFPGSLRVTGERAPAGQSQAKAAAG